MRRPSNSKAVGVNGGRSFRSNALWIGAYASLAVALAYRQGQDLNWDLLNYHFYNPYQWLDDRFARDVHVAGVQSYLNPLLDLPLYFAVVLGVPPPLFLLALAAFHGLALYLIHRITTLVIQPGPVGVAPAAGVLAALTAAFGAGFRSEVGNTMHDNTVAVPVLASLWLLLSYAMAGQRRNLLLAGLLAGAAAGTKLAVAPLCAGLFVCVLTLPGGLRARVRDAAAFSAAGVAGVLLAGGYWMSEMQSHFGSPMFPFLNGVFQSPFAPVQNFGDQRFLPTSALQTVFFPFYWVSTQTLVAEPPFRDARFAVAFVCLFILALQLLMSKTSGEQRSVTPAWRCLLVVAVFWIASYVVWLALFSIYRYVIPLEALTGTLIIGTASWLALARERSFLLAAPICVTLMLSAQVPDFGRIPWSTSYFGVDARALKKYEGATVLMWDFPQGYLVPLFPSSATFLRLVSNWGLEERTAMWDRLLASIARADPERMYLLDHPRGVSHDQQPSTLARLGLERTGGACADHASHHVGFRMCPVRPPSSSASGRDSERKRVPAFER